MNTSNKKVKKVIDWEKIEKLPTANAMLDEKYGKSGTLTRAAFDKRAYAYYYQVIAKAEAKKRKQTVKENMLVSEES